MQLVRNETWLAATIDRIFSQSDQIINLEELALYRVDRNNLYLVGGLSNSDEYYYEYSAMLINILRVLCCVTNS